MVVLENDIKRVNEKLQQLLRHYASLQKENEKLKSTAKKLAGENESRHQHIEQLQQQVNILKTAAGQMSETDKKDFERKINQYIKEVDKCITLLSE